MQIQFSSGVTFPGRKKSYHQQELHLTPRDFDILKFVLEMKFASLEDLARKFFWRPKEYPNGPTLYRTRDRLYKLQINKLIVPEKYPREKKNFYMVSWKGFYLLEENKPELVPCKPLSSPDYTNFEHDKRVLKSRLHLEENFGVTNWISDRTIRAQAGKSGRPKSVQLPDGIYTNRENQKIAFEFENTRKSKSMYAEIIRKYVYIMRSTDLTKRTFERSHFVCRNHSVADLLKHDTRIYSDLFQIQSTEEFFKTHNTIPAKENHNVTTE